MNIRGEWGEGDGEGICSGLRWGLFRFVRSIDIYLSIYLRYGGVSRGCCWAETGVCIRGLMRIEVTPRVLP